MAFVAAAPIGFAASIAGRAAMLAGSAAPLFSARAIGSSLLQSLPYGAGYSFGTYLGFPKNYSGNRTYYKQGVMYINHMPYGRYGGYGYGRYRRRRYYRRYRPRYYRRY